MDGVMRSRGRLAALAALLVWTMASGLAGQTPAVLVQTGTDGQTFEVQCTATLSKDALSFGHVLGYDTVSLPDGGFLVETGKPMLPTQLLYVALPADMAVTGVRVVEARTMELSGQYRLLPAQPPRRLSDPMADQGFVPPDAAIYGSRGIYPPQAATLMGQCDLAGQAMAVVQLCPLQYIPADGRLILCTSMTLVLEGVSGYTCGDYLPTHVSETARDYLENTVATMVANPSDVELRPADVAHLGTRAVAPGDYDYVIITTDGWVSAFQPLADWKTKKGMPANIVTTTWIYANYSGSNVEKIRAFVQDAYTNWGTMFFLLGGDTSYVPYHSRTFSSVDPDPVPNDTYYADFDEDWVVEVHVGRASVVNTGSGAGGIAAFINKVLTFEKNPPASNYAKKAAFFGFDLDSSTPAEQCKIYIDNNYLPADWTLTTVYDSQTGNHKTNVIAAVNSGQVLLNHADHSASNYMGTGYINHNWGLGTSDVDGFSNGSRQSILYSMGCDPAAYDYSNCIAEHFVRDTNGGGLAFIGNSRYGFYSAGSMSTYSMLYDRNFFRSLFPQNNYRLGAAFSDHKNDYYPIDNYYKYIWTELTLLGDPEVPIWTSTPQALAVTHPTSIYAGVSTTFTVQVSTGGSPVSAATVCLWKAGDVYLIGQTNSSGSASFTFAPASTGSMYVTVTGQNRLPYEGTAAVLPASTYTLTVNVNGQGAVDLDPPGGTYSSGTWVQLAASADPGWDFGHWEGSLSGSNNPEFILMDGDKLVTAVFLQGCPGDLDHNGLRNVSDFAAFANAYGSQVGDANYLPEADLNNDGFINASDFALFAAVYSTPCP
jgi:hypothetical protein